MESPPVCNNSVEKIEKSNVNLVNIETGNQFPIFEVDTIIGRGSFDITDERLPHEHCLVKITENQTVSLRTISTIQPIYYRKLCDSYPSCNAYSPKVLLHFDKTVEFTNQDEFYLLPEKASFRVLIYNLSEQKESTENEADLEEHEEAKIVAGCKRKTYSSTSPAKRLKETERVSEWLQKTIKTEPEEVPAKNLESPKGAPSSGNESVCDTKRIKTEIEDSLNKAIKTEVRQEDASESDTINELSNLRQSCTYGVTCYRRNRLHRIEMAHPGDNDYRRPVFSVLLSSVPECPYGTSCYRRNPTHFQQFIHKSQEYTPSAVMLHVGTRAGANVTTSPPSIVKSPKESNPMNATNNNIVDDFHESNDSSDFSASDDLDEDFDPTQQNAQDDESDTSDSTDAFNMIDALIEREE